MLRVLSRAQMREFDRLATALLGIPSVVLMENAGRGAAEVVAEELGITSAGRRPRVLVVAGTGNNAGDGYVLARRLLLLGARVDVYALHNPDRLRGDALVNQCAYVAGGGSLHVLSDEELPTFESAMTQVDVVIDALFGTGLDRPIEGFEREVILRMNAAACPRIALDLPSGLDADTGAALGVAVRAELTITFAAYKPGLLTPQGLQYSGRVRIVDIGVPPSALLGAGESASLLEPFDARAAIGSRAASAHKVASGRVLVLAGSPGKLGAALLVGHGALRAGAGLVTLAGHPELVDALDLRVLEAMTARISPEDFESSLDALLTTAGVVAIGPGIGFDEFALKLVERVVLHHTGPVVVDADAISHFRGQPERLASAAGPRILTPHTGELARLLGATSAEIEADRFRNLNQAVELTRATVLMKGPHTLIATPGRLPVVSSLGSPALATGGAGDVLSGVIAALACQLEPFPAAYVGAYLHARAGESWSRRAGADRGLLAHEIADLIPVTLAELSGGSSKLPV